jgi:hypothetical protein
MSCGKILKRTLGITPIVNLFDGDVLTGMTDWEHSPETILFGIMAAR